MPPPIWRQPAAYVMYGILATIIVVSLGRAARGDEQGQTVDASGLAAISEQAQEQALRDLAPGVIQDAFTSADFEGLVALGDAAAGRYVRAELFCEAIAPVMVRSFEGANPALLRMADSAGRVAGAECRWSRESRSSDILLVVPTELAEEFAVLPEEELNFVRRRRVPATVEWLGRSQELALRTSAVLVEIEE